jgi:hypothetical protein
MREIKLMYNQIYYYAHRDYLLAKRNKYIILNKSKNLQYKKKYRLQYKKQIQEYEQKYYVSHREEQIRKKKVYNKIHKKRIKIRYTSKKYKIRRNFLLKEKRKINILFKIISNLRSRLRSVLKNKKKVDTTLSLIDCTPKFLKKYLESKFRPNMSWDNYGRYGWHIDHIKSCCSFDLSDPKQQKECFHYTNLQPLWAKDNLRKEKPRYAF